MIATNFLVSFEIVHIYKARSRIDINRIKSRIRTIIPWFRHAQWLFTLRVTQTMRLDSIQESWINLAAKQKCAKILQSTKGAMAQIYIYWNEILSPLLFFFSSSFARIYTKFALKLFRISSFTFPSLYTYFEKPRICTFSNIHFLNFRGKQFSWVKFFLFILLCIFLMHLKIRII